jgi:hypothetical protein
MSRQCRLQTIRESHSVCVLPVLGRFHNHADCARWMHNPTAGTLDRLPRNDLRSHGVDQLWAVVDSFTH